MGWKAKREAGVGQPALLPRSTEPIELFHNTCAAKCGCSCGSVGGIKMRNYIFEVYTCNFKGFYF